METKQTTAEKVSAAAWTDGPAGVIAVAAMGYLVDAGRIDAESLVYYGPLAALVARYLVDIARLVGRILKARVTKLEGPPLPMIALLLMTTLLGACAAAQGTVAAGVSGVRQLADQKTQALLLAHETASIARCAANLSSIYRVADLEEAEAIAEFCKALALQQREALRSAPASPKTSAFRPADPRSQ